MNIFFSWFLKPYYFNNTAWFKALVSFSFGTTIFLFLVVFKPFHIETSNNSLLLSFNFGVITFGVLLFNYFVLPAIFKSFFKPELWTVGKEALFGGTCIFFIAICNWAFFNFFVHPAPFSLSQFGVFLFDVLSVGFFPTLVFLFINEKIVRKKRLALLAKVRKQMVLKTKKINQVKNNTFFKIYADNNKDYLEIIIDNLVYITAEGNYVSFFSCKKGREKCLLTEAVLRTTLSQIETVFSENKNIVRCHKSYIINTAFITDLSGNARGYFLQTLKTDFQIPVSRSFSKKDLKSLIS